MKKFKVGERYNTIVVLTKSDTQIEKKSWFVRLLSSSIITNMCTIIALIFTFVTILPYMEQKLGSVKILSTHVMPLERSFSFYDNTSSFQKVTKVEEETVYTNIAAVKTILQNTTEKSILVDRAYVTINDVQPLEHNKVRFVAGLRGNELIIFAVNNNISKAANVNVSTELNAYGIRDTDREKLIKENKERILSHFIENKPVDLAPGEIREIYRATILETAKNYLPYEERGRDAVSLTVKIEHNDIDANNFTIDLEDDGQYRLSQDGGLGGRNFKIRVLEFKVDDWKKGDQYVLDYYEPMSPNSQGFYELAIKPDQSATIKFSLNYLYDGEKVLESEKVKNISLQIYVPFYDVSRYGSVSEELFNTIYHYFDENGISSYKLDTDKEFQEKLKAKNISTEDILQTGSWLW